ncbi:unnamed protein product [Ilex paraguariensis]|uniref:Fungal lipase-type domain-containing protein n=1 Tax=Ilex paraguariensis TaxID=185542 RepID=A0ABC8RXT8_9AQUA
MASNDQISKKHLLLNPDEATFLELFRILGSSEIDDREFMKCLKVTETMLERRGIIFLSTLGQTALRAASGPMSWIGSTVGWGLNLLSGNTNASEKESDKYLSTVGYLDPRMDLDSLIRPGDIRYFPALCAMASKIAYENKAFIKATVEDRWKMKLLGAYDFWNEYQEKHSTPSFMLHDKNANPDMIVVAFRGTDPFDADAFSTDIDISWFKFGEGAGKVHSGFMKALGLQKDETWPKIAKRDDNHPLAYYTIREELREIFRNNPWTKFILTGHSLGGALAILFSAVLVLHEESDILKRVEAVYTFGQPRVGNKKFGDFMEGKFKDYGIRYFRFVYSHDIIPRLPFDDNTLMFKHFGTCLYYDTNYEGQRVAEEPMQDYFSLQSFFTKKIYALKELGRSFIIPFKHGPEYRESWLLQLYRVFGVAALAGLVAHGPQEYINATRLGNADILT